ncbi:MAG: NAD(P)/FAD-dependent oxidoreductase [Myxococcota bacterium]|jgi:all-trans-retinol 13,14-reductase|nr:NAD(P)/FAD-dependent oxidoreductase [Myxococcota bacterium]
MKKWSTWRPENAQEQFDCIIIGSGISGLTTGAILAKLGQKVLILEKHFKIGGWTHTFKRKQYEWDVGIHYIGEVHNSYSTARKLFDFASDGKLEWAKMADNYDRIIFPDKSYDFNAPRQRFIDDLVGHFPGTQEKMEEYISAVDTVVRQGRPYFANKALPEWIAKMTYSTMTEKYFKLANRTTKDVIMSIFNDEKILGVLTGQWGDHGLPPDQSSFAMHAMVVRHYLDGGNYPVGGSRMIAETITDHIEKHGGKTFVNAGVDEILLKKDKAIGVRLENGDEILAPKVVSSAGVVNTYGKLLRSSKHAPTFQKRLRKVVPTGSYLCLYVGFNRSAKDIGLETTNLWIYPDYDHDKNIAEFSADSEKDFPVVYVSFPSAKDPAWDKEHPNSATMEVITMAQFDWYDKWASGYWKKHGDEYEAHKEKLSQRLLEKVFEHVPQAKAHLDYYELSTPLTVRDLANYPQGELYGLEHDPSRFQQRWLKPRSDIKNLFLTGQDILTVGVTSALFSGLVTASAITKKDLRKELL